MFVCVWHIYMGEWKHAATGHTQTCLKPESGASTMHSLQSCQVGIDSLLNMVLQPLLDNAWRGPPFENDRVAPVVGVSGMATIGRMWVDSEKLPLSTGGIRSRNLATSNDYAPPKLTPTSYVTPSELTSQGRPRHQSPRRCLPVVTTCRHQRFLTLKKLLG